MASVGRDPFARGEYDRMCWTQEHEKCSWCGQHRRRLYSYVWTPDDRPQGVYNTHLYSKVFCNIGCFKSYHS